MKKRILKKILAVTLACLFGMFLIADIPVSLASDSICNEELATAGDAQAEESGEASITTEQNIEAAEENLTSDTANSKQKECCPYLEADLKNNCSSMCYVAERGKWLQFTVNSNYCYKVDLYKKSNGKFVFVKNLDKSLTYKTENSVGTYKYVFYGNYVNDFVTIVVK